MNKAQDFSGPDEDEIDALPDSLILQIQKYFVSGPDIILLPTLQWDNDVKPDFNENVFSSTMIIS